MKQVKKTYSKPRWKTEIYDSGCASEENLTKEEEYALIIKAQSGEKMRGVVKKLKEEELETAKKVIEEGEVATETLVRSNQRLVYAISQTMLTEVNGLSAMDHIQNGNIGLMQAIKKFDIERDFRFSTYAYRVIKNYMMRENNRMGHTIYIPQDTRQQKFEIDESIQIFQYLHKRKPNTKEISEMTGIPESKVKFIEKTFCESVPLSTFEVVDNNSQKVILNLPLEAQTDKSLESNPDEAITEKTKTELLWKYLNRLPETQKRIVFMHYGLDGKRIMTLREIADTFDKSYEWARKQEIEAFKTIKTYAKSLEFICKADDVKADESEEDITCPPEWLPVVKTLSALCGEF